VDRHLNIIRIRGCDLWDPAGVNSIDFSKIKKDCDLLRREYNCQVDIERINYKQYTNKTYYSCDDGGFLNVIDNDDIFICYAAHEKRTKTPTTFFVLVWRTA
jgi:hypothetical protein